MDDEVDRLLALARSASIRDRFAALDGLAAHGQRLEAALDRVLPVLVASLTDSGEFTVTQSTEISGGDGYAWETFTETRDVVQRISEAAVRALRALGPAAWEPVASSPPSVARDDTLVALARGYPYALAHRFLDGADAKHLGAAIAAMATGHADAQRPPKEPDAILIEALARRAFDPALVPDPTAASAATALCRMRASATDPAVVDRLLGHASAGIRWSEWLEIAASRDGLDEQARKAVVRLVLAPDLGELTPQLHAYLDNTRDTHERARLAGLATMFELLSRADVAEGLALRPSFPAALRMLVDPATSGDLTWRGNARFVIARLLDAYGFAAAPLAVPLLALWPQPPFRHPTLYARDQRGAPVVATLKDFFDPDLSSDLDQVEARWRAGDSRRRVAAEVLRALRTVPRKSNKTLVDHAQRAVWALEQRGRDLEYFRETITDAARAALLEVVKGHVNLAACEMCSKVGERSHVMEKGGNPHPFVEHLSAAAPLMVCPASKATYDWTHRYESYAFGSEDDYRFFRIPPDSASFRLARRSTV